MKYGVTMSVIAGVLLAGGTALANDPFASQWDFKDNIDATFGPGLMSWGLFGESESEFGTTTDFGINDIGDEVGQVMKFNVNFGLDGILVDHGAPSNIGLYLNEYTMIWDLYVPQSSFDTFDWLSFYNTNCTNSNDGDLFIRYSDGGIGISGVYDGQILADTWHRIVITWTYDSLNDTLDLTKYIDGIEVGFQDDWMGVDGTWALYTQDDGDPDCDTFHLLSDDSGDHADGYISSFYFVDRPLDSNEVAALGGADADGPFGDGSGDCLTMQVSALVAGQNGIWRVDDATPGEQVAIVWGTQPGQTLLNGFAEYCSDFGIKGVNQNRIVCRKKADGAGVVSCNKTIPTGAQGLRVLTQASERGTCPDPCMSNIDDQIIQ